jgi:hypothetical protein
MPEIKKAVMSDGLTSVLDVELEVKSSGLSEARAASGFELEPQIDRGPATKLAEAALLRVAQGSLSIRFE